MKKYDYKKDYPDGVEWHFWKKFVSPMLIQLKGNKCEKCGSTKNLLVHHTDYTKEVNIHTLKVWCRKCHQKEHRNKK